MRRLTVFGLALCGTTLTGCAGGDPSRAMIAHMDSLPPEEQLPNWQTTRARMLREPPAVGDVAPDFTLETRSGDAKVTLSQFRDDRPVVLIFGSWT